MPVFATECEAIKDLAQRQSIQLPKEGDIDVLQLFQETVPAGSRLILTFPVERGFTVHISEIEVDFFDTTNYSFQFQSRGQVFAGDNVAPFSVPQKETISITIIIENLSASAETYSGHIKGFGNTR